MSFTDIKYCPETGELSGIRPPYLSGGTKKGGEYLTVYINGKSYYLHRLAFFLMTGRWPAHHIDHINGIKTDNRWCNLREATMSQNKANEGLRSSNKSGLKGVSWHKGGGKWEAHGTRYLGLYDCPAAAHFAYLIDASKRYGDYARGI